MNILGTVKFVQDIIGKQARYIVFLEPQNKYEKNQQ